MSESDLGNVRRRTPLQELLAVVPPDIKSHAREAFMSGRQQRLPPTQMRRHLEAELGGEVPIPATLFEPSSQ